LIELIRRCAFRIKPYISRFCFTEFATIGLSDKRASESKSFATIYATDKLGASGDISPLVGTAHLQAATFRFVKMKEVISLKKLVREFSERHALLCIATKTLFHRVLSHHIVDSDVLTYIADEIKETIVLHPVVVVYEFSVVRCVAIKIQEFSKLLFDAFLIMAKSHFVNKDALLRFHGWVTNHAGSSTNKR